MAEGWTEGRRRTLAALCDTFIPAVAPPAVEADDPTGFWRRAASDLDVGRQVMAILDRDVAPDDRDGMLKLLDVLRSAGLTRLPQAGREGLVKALRRTSDDVARGLDGYRDAAMFVFYGAPDDDGTNPNWAQLGYPGPPAVDDAARRPHRLTSEPVTTATTLGCDVVVVGSGSGGGVVAGELARAGRDVVIVEAGGHLEDADFLPYELPAYRQLYWRGGFTPTDDGNVTVVAGATLGGGSTVNWTNCVRTPDRLRTQWAREHGIDGLDGREFDDHLDAVMARVGATPTVSDPNGPNARLEEAAAKLGWSAHRTARNTDPQRYDPASAGHVGFGDRTGSKQGTLKTYLEDAQEAGARLLTRAAVRRIVVEHGRAAGVEGRVRTADGREVPFTISARQVVVAGGALETPALLLRSGIGGPAVGRYLRLHPVPAITGFYREPQDAWWGAPQTVLVDEFSDPADGYGFLVETPHFGLGLTAASIPWRGGRDHKVIMGRGAHAASFIAVTRDHGSGRVTIDDAGEAVLTYPIDDARDLATLRKALEVMVRLHAAAGAEVQLDLHPSRPVLRPGQSLEAWIGRLLDLGFGARARPLFSAHQMGTARMGTDPATSVADPDGQLHDVPGVWIGDTSAFPTAAGVNPMITCMALARRTAVRVAAAAGSGAG